ALLAPQLGKSCCEIKAEGASNAQHKQTLCAAPRGGAASCTSHATVAPFPVNNRPETGKPGRRSFPTAAGWSRSSRGKPPKSQHSRGSHPRNKKPGAVLRPGSLT